MGNKFQVVFGKKDFDLLPWAESVPTPIFSLFIKNVVIALSKNEPFNFKELIDLVYAYEPPKNLKVKDTRKIIYIDFEDDEIEAYNFVMNLKKGQRNFIIKQSVRQILFSDYGFLTDISQEEQSSENKENEEDTSIEKQQDNNKLTKDVLDKLFGI